MRTVAHVSDLHFGRTDAAVLHSLAQVLLTAKPDLLVVSGDMTQRARIREFAEARKFLESLPSPRLAVPGNHDLVPWFNPLGRWLHPLERYRRFISADTEPLFADDEMVVAGVNTTRRNTVESGRLNEAQVERACGRFSSAPRDRARLLVTHHPFDLPEHYRGHDVVGRASMAMTRFAKCGVDAFLSGHLHLSHIGESTLRYQIAGYSALVVQAGTAASTRSRGELNSWNLIRISHPDIWVERQCWNQARGKFVTSGCDHFRRTNRGWLRWAEDNRRNASD